VRRDIAALSGNWQFSLDAPGDLSFVGTPSPPCPPPVATPNQIPVCSGGFLLQSKGTVTGSIAYAISLPSQSGGLATVCNSGSAPITGTINGQNVTLTAVAATQTFVLTGSLSSDGTTMSGTYTSTAGTGPGGTPCGTAQSGLQWRASSVPPLTGQVHGSFHSTSGPLSNQDFPLNGMLTQGENIGANNATVTGTLNFVDPVSLLSNYPCFDTASINGQISGNVVILQIIGSNGSNLGQIGGVANSGVQAVTFDSTANGRVLHSGVTPAYAVNTKTCPGIGLANAGDAGSICLGLNGTVCQQPITLSPAFVTFPPQLLGSAPTTQTITLSNSDPSGSTLNGLSLDFQPSSGGLFPGFSDFNGLANFSQQDNCSASLGSSFSLAPGQSCSISITFSPQEGCPWLPYGNPPSLSGAPPSLCPFPLTAKLIVNSPASADNDTTFVSPITGFGISAVAPSTPELDFGAEAVSEASPAQTLSFTNVSANPVQVLGSAACLNSSGSFANTLPRPLQIGSPVGGLQVASNDTFPISPNSSTIDYLCDSDPNSLLPNFQISADTCSGALLTPQASCSLQVSFTPQPGTALSSGLDYFLELNTVQCSGMVTSDCEIDSGRFPVELKANPPSPLRMTPAAGLDFGIQPIGDPTFVPVAKTITLFNDPSDPNSGTVNFIGKISAKGDYIETDTCPFSLPPGASCTLTVTFNPKIEGFDPGSITINYTPEPTGIPQTVYLRGAGHFVFQ